MTTSTSRYVLTEPRSRALPAELLDGITDAVVSAPDSQARAEVIGGLVEEIYASVAWLSTEPHCEELVSLQRLLHETDAHRERLKQSGRLLSPTCSRDTEIDGGRISGAGVEDGADTA